MSSLDQGPRGRQGPPGSFGEKGLVGAQVGLTNSRLNTAAHSSWPVRRPVCPWTNNGKIHCCSGICGYQDFLEIVNLRK